MEDDEIRLLNACTDLVSLRRCEAFPAHLLETKQAGEWVCVRDVCAQIGLDPGAFMPELCAAWLSDPMAHKGYAVILFYDGETQWSMAAHYNRGRLLNNASPDQLQERVGLAVPGASGASCATSEQPGAAG